ncbi:glycosyltransferase family 39 protein [Actinoplanes sp. KI2]|uniref:ArnT family glycosyltransferase n=1 Tax=Actinoplanes sp. KI2 TaxID=2983315 RepID=UPI0021D58DC8|nr:glycosyltransferase family 39 protein [Actinoplanes sp. KI2]MCU7728508.1 glycosyltransferase family 39 protein [Actinoplanes sp. KI2]
MTAVELAKPISVVPAATDGVRKRKLKGNADLAIALGLTALMVTLLAWNIAGFPSASDDEGTYLAQAWAVQHGRGLAHYTYWYDHPPLGWIQLAGLSWLPAMLAPGLLAVAAGRIAMLPVQAIGLLLVYLVSRRIGMPRWAASLALITYGLSPLCLTMGRQIYLDSFAVVWILGAFALALSPRKHLWHFAAAGAAAAVAILSKETIAVVLPAVLVAMWQNTARSSTRPWAFGAFASGLVLAGCFYPLYAVLRGELFPGPGHVSLIGAWGFQLGSRSGSGSVFSSGSGASSLLHSWLYYDPVILLAGAVACSAGLALRRVRPIALAGAILVVVALRPGGYLPAMYVVQVLPFFAIAIAGVVAWGVTTLRPGRVWWRWAALGAMISLSVLVVAPRWYVGDRRALSVDDNAPYVQAADYLRAELPGRAGATVVVDDVLWLDCVNAGYPPDKVIWFYKIDLDSAVAKRLPDGWRDVDYVVSTPAMRQDPNSLPTVRTLLTRSTVIASFGPPGGQIEIRRVDKETP